MENMQEQYKKNIEIFVPPRPFIKNAFKAFFIGGLICALGEWISYGYMYFFPFTKKESLQLSAATLICIAALTTGFGLYDRLGQFAGAGALVPLTGFTNALTSSALEFRSEGFIFGIGAHMFQLAGPLIVCGVLSAYTLALTRLLLSMLIRGEPLSFFIYLL